MKISLLWWRIENKICYEEKWVIPFPLAWAHNLVVTPGTVWNRPLDDEVVAFHWLATCPVPDNKSLPFASGNCNHAINPSDMQQNVRSWCEDFEMSSENMKKCIHAHSNARSQFTSTNSSGQQVWNVVVYLTRNVQDVHAQDNSWNPVMVAMTSLRLFWPVIQIFSALH